MFMSVQQSAHVITVRLSLRHSPAQFNSLLVVYLVPHILRVSKIWCQLVSFKQWWEYFGWSNAKTLAPVFLQRAYSLGSGAPVSAHTA